MPSVSQVIRGRNKKVTISDESSSPLQLINLIARVARMSDFSRVLCGRNKKDTGGASPSLSLPLHDLIARLDYTAALERLRSHPQESNSLSSSFYTSPPPSPSPSPSPSLPVVSMTSLVFTENRNRKGNLPLAEAYRFCLETTSSSVGVPLPPFEFVDALVRSFPRAVMCQIFFLTEGGGSILGVDCDVTTVCRGFTPLHALCYLSRHSTDTQSTDAALATMLHACPQAVHVCTPTHQWLPLHAACAPSDPSAPPPPPQVALLSWLVGTFPGSVLVEDGNGECPLSMFWRRYHVSPEEGGRGREGVEVRHADGVWRVLRCMAEAAYHKSLADDFRGVEEERPRCFRVDVVRGPVGDGGAAVEMKQFAVREERRRRFRPLVAFAGFEATTEEMMAFAVARCRMEEDGRAADGTNADDTITRQ